MKKILLSCGLLALGLAAYLQAQPGGGRPMGQGGQGRGGGMFALESDWALICFELKVDKKAFDKLWAVYQKAWDQRQELIEQMKNEEIDRDGMMAQMTQIQTELDKGSREILTAEQMQQLEKLRAQRREAWQGGGQRNRGPGGGGGGPQ